VAEGGVEAPAPPELEPMQVQMLEDLRAKKGVPQLKHLQILKKANAAEVKFLSNDQFQKYIDYLNTLPDKEELTNAQ
jgi:hypothetical protein